MLTNGDINEKDLHAILGTAPKLKELRCDLIYDFFGGKSAAATPCSLPSINFLELYDI